MNRWLGVFIMALFFTGCFDSVHLPRCKVLADCPVTSLSCEQGYCFNDQPTCDSNALDGCCPTNGDRSNDADCLIHQIDLQKSISTITTKPATFGPPVVDGDYLYLEASTSKGLVMIGFDADKTEVSKPYSAGTARQPAAVGGYCLFPLGDAFSLWGPGMEVILTDKTTPIVQAVGYNGVNGIMFYAVTKDGDVVSIDTDGKVSDLTENNNIDRVLVQPKNSTLIACDQDHCEFFDLTSTPPDSSRTIEFERSATGIVHANGDYLWVPSGEGLDVYSIDPVTQKRITTVNLNGEITKSGNFGSDQVWVIAGDSVTIVSVNGKNVEKQVLDDTKGPLTALNVCNGLAVLGDTTGLYLDSADRWDWNMKISDPSDQPFSNTALVVWGARLCYVSQAGALMGIPLNCEVQ